MEKERNCFNGYPAYQMNPGFNGMMPTDVFPMPYYNQMPSYGVDGTNDLKGLTTQINALERRVSRLENLVNNGSYSNNYNSSNYQMM